LNLVIFTSGQSRRELPGHDENVNFFEKRLKTRIIPMRPPIKRSHPTRLSNSSSRLEAGGPMTTIQVKDPAPLKKISGEFLRFQLTEGPLLKHDMPFSIALTNEDDSEAARAAFLKLEPTRVHTETLVVLSDQITTPVITHPIENGGP
jgi:hypothetical protein